MRTNLSRLRLRFRLGTLLILVALLGLMLGGWQMMRRRQYCLERAAEWEERALINSDMLMGQREELAILHRHFHDHPEHWLEAESITSMEKDVEARRSLVDHLTEMTARYGYFADHPWLPLPREPEPE